MAVKVSELDLQEIEQPLLLKDGAPAGPPAPKKEEAAGDMSMVYAGFAISAAFFCMICMCNKSKDVDDYDEEAPMMEG